MQKLPFIVSLLAISASSVAYADDTSNTSPPPSTADPTSYDSGDVSEGAATAPVAAPKNAFEIGVNGGYTQPFGKIDHRNVVQDSVEAGGGVGLSLGYRASPHWGIAAEGNYHESATDSSLGTNSSARGVAAGLTGTYHFLPYDTVDPYAALGTGYRLLWINPGGAAVNELVHGFEIAKGTVGVDFRASPSVALGPMAGADVNMFVWRRTEATGVNENIDGKSVNTFIYAGLGGRFDLGGDRVSPHKAVAYVPPPPAPTPAAAPAEPRPVVPPPAPITESIVNVSETITSACGIAKPSAFFKFDSANLQSNDLSTLDAVAECFKTGPLKGRKMSVVGRADPRGTDAYNLKLGVSRAQSVSKYLTDKGVEDAQVVMSTAGEINATGVDENGWAYDRRVDIVLIVE